MYLNFLSWLIALYTLACTMSLSQAEPPTISSVPWTRSLQIRVHSATFTRNALGGFLCLLQFYPTSKAQFIDCPLQETFPSPPLVAEDTVQMLNRTFTPLWGLAPAHRSSLSLLSFLLALSALECGLLLSGGCARPFHATEPLYKLFPPPGRLSL